MNPSPFARAFLAPEHQPFTLPGGRPAALLVHGFPGTPAEMRPLGQALNRAGWSVQGLLLPGFGPQIETLFERRSSEWVGAILDALLALEHRHAPLLLVGFSLGAALCLEAASSLASATGQLPAALALLAPYWKLPGPLWDLLPVLRWLFPAFRPFQLVKLDFSEPQTRRGIDNFMPGVDLDDPQVQSAIHNFTIPVRLLAEIRQVGQAGWRAAERVHAPTLVLQGAHDDLVRTNLTRRLLQRLPGPLHYQELPAGHDLLDPHRTAWSQVEAAVLQFAAQAVSAR